jgi:hypothetical protein
MSDLSFNFYNPILSGNRFIGNFSDRVQATWKHRTRRIGGWWTADCEYRGDRGDLEDMFLRGLMRDVRASLGSLVAWQGFVGAMSYLRDGVLWTLSMADRANAIKLIYTRLGDNLLTNGSAESGAWTAVNGATVTQSTEWVTDGSYSCKIVVADTTVRGADIQASLSITANAAYTARVSLHVLSGSWRVAINRTDTDAKIAAGSTRGQLGDVTITLTIPDTNTYGGTVRFRITSEASAGTVYGDGAVLQIPPARAETEWKTDPAAIAQYGRIENAILDASLTSTAANAKAATLLKTHAWPIITPPDEYTIGARSGADRLKLNLFGYIFTAGWRICPITGTQDVTAIIQSLIATQSDYLVEGTIEGNDIDYQIDDRLPLTLWTVASEAAAAGDAAGNRWSLMCRGDRRIDYFPTPTATAYHYRGGRLYSPSGTLLEDWQIQPGWMQLDDAPGLAGQITGSGYDQIRRIYLEEIEYSAANGVTFRAAPDG